MASSSATRGCSFINALFGIVLIMWSIAVECVPAVEAFTLSFASRTTTIMLSGGGGRMERDMTIMNRRSLKKVFHTSTRTDMRGQGYSSISLLQAEAASSSSMEHDVPDLKCNEIMRFRGAVAEGYGRGGKKLGFPTANLPASLFSTALTQVPTGVYFGWATIETTATILEGPYKAVVNVGYSPTFDGAENKEKIIEAHLITSMPSNEETEEPEITTIPDFYHQPMRLLLGGYLRPEQKFPSFPDLIAAIHNDVDTANMALDQEPFSKLRKDSFLTEDGSSSGDNHNRWVGSSGGDANASWEFQPFSDPWSNLES